MTGRVMAHIKLGILSVSPSDQSPRGENPQQNKSFLFFLREKNLFCARGVSR